MSFVSLTENILKIKPYNKQQNGEKYNEKGNGLYYKTCFAAKLLFHTSKFKKVSNEGWISC